MTTQVTCPLEQWFTAVYALWSEHSGGHWQLIGGHFLEDTSDTKVMLSRDWDIHNLEEGLSMVAHLTDKNIHNSPDTDGWDYCRAMHLLSFFYVAGFLSRADMVARSCQVGSVLQQSYHSWDELCTSFLAGYEIWCRREYPSDRAEGLIQYRRDLFQRLRGEKDGPYRLPWNMSLTPDAWEFPGFYQLWLAREEAWIAVHRGKVKKLIWLAVMPLLFLFLCLLFSMAAAMQGYTGISAVGMGAGMALFPLLLVLPFLPLATRHVRRGRISKLVGKAAHALGLSDADMEQLGVEMLDALLDPKRRLDYVNKDASGQKTPAKLLVTKSYFYQMGALPPVVLVRRADVEEYRFGEEPKLSLGRRFNAVSLYTILFYFRSGGERLSDGTRLPDAGMGFYDCAVRDKAYAMMTKQHSGSSKV